MYAGKSDSESSGNSGDTNDIGYNIILTPSFES